LGARVVPVPVDGEGLVVDALPDDARLVYVTPSHQYPLGMPMSLPRRRALLAWAARRDAAIVEDDYDSEFRFTGAPLEPLQALDTDGRVIYVGSFSKSMLPTLRLGFLVTPASLRPALHTAKFLTDWHTALPAQAALARFVEEGLLARHLRRMRAEYRARHEQVTRLLTGDLAAWLTPVPSRAGLHLSALLHDEVDVPDVAVTRRARSAGVHVDPLSRFCAGPARHGIVLGYGALPPDRIGPAFARLREAFQASSP
jgi:GntR family transcriptional regulator/MocR family aminotransferase